MLDPKLIKNLAGVLSLVFAVCVLVSSGFLLSKVVPVYNNSANGELSIPSLNTKGPENRTKNSVTVSGGPPTLNRNSIKDIFEASSGSSSFDFSDSAEGTKSQSSTNTTVNGTKIGLNLETVGENVVDTAIGEMLRKKRAVTTTNDHISPSSSIINNGPQTSSSVVTVMNTICLDEWARFIGLSVGGIVVSLAQISLYTCHFWGMEKHYPSNLPLSSTAIWILTNLILDMILWLLIGLSLYSSHCTRATFTKERSLFSFFVGMDATMLFITLAFLKLSRDGGRRIHNNHHNKFYDDNDDDEEVDEGNFSALPQRLRLQTTDH